MTMLYGSRARIGYCSPPYITEVFAYEFYKMVPDGVTLLIRNLEVRTRAPEEIELSHKLSLEAARYMAGAGADVVVLGGNPINQSVGVDELPDLCERLGREIGTRVTTSTQSQVAAMRALGARKVAQVHCYDAGDDERHKRSIRNMGFEPAGVVAVDCPDQLVGRIPRETALTLARRVKTENPDADCIHFASAHWATAHAIDAVERELGVSVMTSQQAITWNALRTAGVREPIEGFGRLFREF